MPYFINSHPDIPTNYSDSIGYGDLYKYDREIRLLENIKTYNIYFELGERYLKHSYSSKLENRHLMTGRSELINNDLYNTKYVLIRMLDPGYTFHYVPSEQGQMLRLLWTAIFK